MVATEYCASNNIMKVSYIYAIRKPVATLHDSTTPQALVTSVQFVGGEVIGH